MNYKTLNAIKSIELLLEKGSDLSRVSSINEVILEREKEAYVSTKINLKVNDSNAFFSSNGLSGLDPELRCRYFEGVVYEVAESTVKDDLLSGAISVNADVYLEDAVLVSIQIPLTRNTLACIDNILSRIEEMDVYAGENERGFEVYNYGLGTSVSSFREAILSQKDLMIENVISHNLLDKSLNRSYMDVFMKTSKSLGQSVVESINEHLKVNKLSSSFNI